MRDLYIAAPFFNPLELDVVERIYRECRARPNHLSSFSPYHYNLEVQGNLQDPAVRRKIFLDNARELRDCSEVLAWVDRLQPEGREVWLLDGVQDPDVNRWRPTKGPLEQPDLGTVWELGFANALGKNCFLFTFKPRGEGKLNLMLTEGAVGVIHGWEELVTFLDVRHPWGLRELLDTWSGRQWEGQVE